MVWELFRSGTGLINVAEYFSRLAASRIRPVPGRREG